MATTPNYQLHLPSLEDEADITKLNENFTKIDEVLKENENNHIAKKIIYTDNQQLNATNVQDAIDNVAIKAAKALEIAEKALQTMEDLFYVIGMLPSQNGSLTYSGSTLSPTWDNYDSQKLTLGGTISGTNAGTYMATFTPKGKYKWSNGTQTPVSVPWTIGRAVVALPTQSGSLRYTGSTLSPSWSNYDSAKLTLGGTTSAINAGNYTATFTPKDNYKFSDGVTTAKIVYWKIAKAAGSFSLSTTQISVNNVYGEKTVTVSRAGNGAIHATPQHSNIATCSVSGATITIQPKTTGHTTITVSVAEGTNHDATTTKNISVDVVILDNRLYMNSWETIAEVSASGRADTIWNVGDTKDIVVNGETLTVEIIGFAHDDKADGTGKAGITFGLQNLPNIEMQLVGDTFTDTKVYKQLQGSTFSALPPDLQSVIKTVNKKTFGHKNHTIHTAAMKLFLFSEIEVFGSTTFSAAGEGTQYSSFANPKNRQKFRLYQNSNGSYSGYAKNWWVRSPKRDDIARYCCVNQYGEVGSSGTGNVLYVCFGFCV